MPGPKKYNIPEWLGDSRHLPYLYSIAKKEKGNPLAAKRRVMEGASANSSRSIDRLKLRHYFMAATEGRPRKIVAGKWRLVQFFLVCVSIHKESIDAYL